MTMIVLTASAVVEPLTEMRFGLSGVWDGPVHDISRFCHFRPILLLEESLPGL